MWLWIHNVYMQDDSQDREKTLYDWEEALKAPGEHLTVGDLNAHHIIWGGVCAEPDGAGHTVVGIMDRIGLESMLPEGTITWEKAG